MGFLPDTVYYVHFLELHLSLEPNWFCCFDIWTSGLLSDAAAQDMLIQPTKSMSAPV